MTNAQIIFNQSVALMEAGKIGTTGRTLTVEDENGNRKQIPEPEPLHTYKEWAKMGLQVRKGEHAVATFSIWMFDDKKRRKTAAADPADENPNTLPDDAPSLMKNFYMKNAHFFAWSQVVKPAESNGEDETESA